MRFKGMGRDRKYEIPACGRQARYEIRDLGKCRTLNAQCRMLNWEN
jgi:hypothetical protein